MENKTLPPCATETVDNIQCIHYPGKLQECFDCGIICSRPQTEQAEASSLSDLLCALRDDTRKREATEKAKTAHYADKEDYLFAMLSAHDEIMYGQFANQLDKIIGI